MDIALLVVGIAVAALTAASVLFTMVLPRSPRGFERASLLVNRLARISFLALSRLARTYEAKDVILAPTGPAALVAQLLTWAGGFIVGFALMLYPTTGSFGGALLQAT